MLEAKYLWNLMLDHLDDLSKRPHLHGLHREVHHLKWHVLLHLVLDFVLEVLGCRVNRMNVNI